MQVSRRRSQSSEKIIIFFLPYLMGERSHNNPDARGTFIGASMDTTRADMAQAVLEGVAFAIRDSFEIARSSVSPSPEPRSAAAEPRALSGERSWPTCLAFPWTS